MASLSGNPHAVSIVAIIVFGFCFVPLSFALRLWARRISAIEFWWDDFLMALALVGALAVVADNCVGLHFGEGYHVEDLSGESIEKYAQTVFAFFFLQTFTVNLIKASLLLLYWRTFTLTRFRYAIYVVGVVILANAFTNVLGFIFQCIPVEKFWRVSLQGRCINQTLFIMLASLFYIITDFAIYLMPIPLIWHLQMTRRRRMELSFVFLIGGFVCLTGIARLVTTIRIDVRDLPYTNAAPEIWNMVESQLGFVAANIPSMGPVFGKASSAARKIRHGYHQNRSGYRTHQDSAALHSAARRGSAKGFERMLEEEGETGVEVSAGSGRTDRDLELAGVVPTDGIVVKTNMEQNSEIVKSRI